MTSLTLATLLQMSVAAVGSHTYAEARRDTTETGKPMVVMVSAEWCGPCQAMKKTVLPQIQKRGLMQKVSFAIVNVDREGALARKLTGGGPVPQLVMFRRNGNGWLRKKLVGGQSVTTVEKFIVQGIARDEETKRAAGKKQASRPSKEEHAKEETAEKPTVRPASRRK